MRTRLGALVAVIALVAGLQVVTATVAPVPSAQAAPVNVGSISAQMADQRGRNNGLDGNCIRYSPKLNDTSTTLVTSPAEAITAHGARNGNCPTNLSTTNQSALGFRPSAVTSADDGVPFLIGRMIHYNNPIQSSDQYYTGKMRTVLGGFATPNTLTFNWTMNETPNTGGGNCCDDITTFDNQISDVTLTQGGLTYKLVIIGFVAVPGQTACPDTPAAGSNPQNEFRTVEGAQTNACLYAELQQVRSLQIVKNVAGSPPGNPSFNYTTTSSLDGSPWSNGSFALTNGGVKQDVLTAGNTVTVTEADTGDDRWALTALACQQYNAAGSALVDVPGVTINLAARRANLTNIPAPLYAADPVIICTYTNTYTPRTTLTLVKQVQGNVVSPTLWTLTAEGTAPPTTGVSISGPSGSAAVTNQRIVAGSYRLSERGTGAAATGFVQVGNWVCGAGGTDYPVNDGVVTLPDLPAGTAVTCQVENRQASGTLQISKTVRDPNGGYTGGTGKTFTGTYNCGSGYTGTFTVTTATPFTVTGIPAGRTCTVTEDTPTGGLLNGSFAWGTPTFSAQPVPIVDNQTATVAITNPVVQRFGTFSVSKVINGPGGYTGGPNRVFPVDYSCTLTNGPASNGTLTVTPSQPAGPPAPLPVGSVCTFSEDLTAQAGDFGDPSYRWVPPGVFDPASVTIAENTTAAVTVTNTYARDTGQLVLAKIVDGDGYVGTGEPFTVRYNCGVVSGQVSLAPGGSKSVTVPAGNTCSVTEDTPDAALLDAGHVWGAPIWTPGASATIPVNGSATLTVTNPTQAVFGRVQVTKRLAGDNLEGVTAQARFAVTVTCDDATGYTTTFTLAVNGAGLTDNLPVGTSCTITEAPPTGGLVDSSYAWGPATISPTTVTITQSGQVATSTVTNTVTRVRGDLEISKRLVDPDGVVAAGRTFDIAYTCVYSGPAGAATTVSLAAGESTTITGILLGSRCTVTEDPATLDAPPSAGDPSYVWLPPTYDPSSGTVDITSDTTPAKVTVINRVDRLLGTFQLTKSVVGPGKAGGYTAGTTFAFSVDCGPDDTWTVDLADAATWSPDRDVPVGTECTITETGKPPTPAAYAWQDVQFAVNRVPGNGTGSSVTFTVGDDPIQVIATNPIVPLFGSLELTKFVTGETQGLADGAVFTLSVNCGPGNLFVVRLDGLVNDTETVLVDNIPAGTTCTVYEFPPDPDDLVDASYAWEPAIYLPSPATVTIEADEAAQVTVTNPIVRVTAPVQMIKTVIGGQGVVDPDRTYPISWSCTYDGQTVASGSLDLAAGPPATQVADGVPVTAQCAASETTPLDPPSTDPAYRWLDPIYLPVTVTQAGPNTFGVINSVVRDSGEVLVRKVVTGATDGYVNLGDPTVQDFTLHGTCAVPADPSIPPRFANGTIADGGVATQKTIEASIGWTCSGSEDTPGQNLLVDSSYAWGTPILTWGPTTDTTPPAPTPQNTGPFVLTRANPTVAFWAQNPIVRVSSTFRITKTVVDPFGAVPEDTEFAGTWSCTYGDDAPVTGTWSLVSGATYTSDPVYLNSVCTVTETTPLPAVFPDGSFNWADPAIGAPVTVVPGGTATVPVTNTVQRNYAGLQVTKTLVAPDGGVNPGTQFTGVWTCTLGGQTWSDRWTVGANASTIAFTAADDRVPATAVCTIIEDTPSQAALVDGSYAWADRVYDPPSVTLVAGETADLGVTNTVVRVYSGFDVTKAITGLPDGLVPTGRPFTGTWSCQYGTDAPVTGTWTASVATPWSQPGILVGSVCSVTAETPPGAGGQPVADDPSYIWRTPDLGDPVTVTAPTEANEAVIVTNPTDRQFGRFFITKQVSGAVGGFTDRTEPFPLSYSCQPGAGAPITGTAEILAGQKLTVGPDAGDDIRLQLPLGSVCTLTEPGPASPPMPPLVDGAYSWAEPLFTVEGDIPTAGPVTVTCADPVVTPCLGSRSVTVTIPQPQEDYPEPPTVGLLIDNPVDRAYGAWTVAKSSDPASGSTVEPGDPITYSVTVTSTGEVPVHDVVVTDDLSQVLPNATIGTITAPDGTTAVVDPDTQQLVWTVGDLPAAGQDGAALTLTYTATVNPGATGATIRNVVTGDGDVPPTTCAEPDPDDPACSTVHTTPDPPLITKELNGQPAFDTTTGNWTVPYRITVTNPNADDPVTYTLTDGLAYPTDVTIVSGTVTASPDGVTLFDPAWNGSDQTTIAADAALPGGATHTYDIAVVATVPLTLDGASLACADAGSGGGAGFFNRATIDSLGTESSDDACAPIPVALVAVKQWTIDGVSYANGSQPSGYAASLTLDGVDRTWGTIYVGYQPGAVVAVGESVTLPTGCTSTSSGTGDVTLNQPVTAVRVVNVVTCATPPTPTPTPNPPTPYPTPTPNPYPPYPPNPLPNTGFAVQPWVAWGLGLLLIGGFLVYLGGRRRRGLHG